DLVVAFARSIVVALIGLFLMADEARSGDYGVAWAFAADDRNETGIKEDCKYKASCAIKLENFGFEITVRFWKSDRKIATIDISRRQGCCYFAGGDSTVERDAKGFIRLGVFEGHRRQRNEFVLNAPVGQLYLLFADFN